MATIGAPERVRVIPKMFALWFAGFAGLSLAVGLAPRASAPFTTSIDSPVGGEVWTRGSTHDVIWTDDIVDPGEIFPEVLWYLVAGVPQAVLWSDIYGYGGQKQYTWTVPAQDLADVTVRVCVDPGAGPVCIDSNPFRIEGVSPVLLARSPEGTNIEWRPYVNLSFSEAMDEASVRGALSIFPPASIFPGWTWSANDSSTRVVLAPSTSYTFTLSCAAVDRSGTPGNPLAGCPISWSFTTSAAPTISLTSPLGGEVWSGGSTHSVAWLASDAEDLPSALRIVLWYYAGAGYQPLAGPLWGNASYDWTLPMIDSSNVQVGARVRDTANFLAEAYSGMFAIDSTRPAVFSTVPADNASGVDWASSILVDLTEPATGPLDGTTFGVRTSSGEWVDGALVWESSSRFRFTPSSPYLAGTEYIASVNATLTDLSDPGNALVPVSWRFFTKVNTLPSVSLDWTPAAVLSGGSIWSVSWTGSDGEDDPSQLEAYLEFSDVGPSGPFGLVAGSLNASDTYAFTVPLLDVASASLRVRVVDSQGGEASSSVSFGIDSTPPTVEDASPPPGATDVLPNAGFAVTFSEPMRRPGWSIGLREAVSGVWVEFGISAWFGQTFGAVPANLLREGLEYEAVINGTPRDMSAPGNPLAGATSWTFRVGVFPPSITIVDPLPGVRWTAGVSHLIRVQVADPWDSMLAVRVDLALDGTNFAPFLAATSVALGEVSLAATPPLVEAPVAVLRVCATDAEGTEACALRPISIDATRPNLLSATPAQGASTVHPGAPLLLTFSEPMDAAAVEAAFRLDPATAVTFQWGRTFADNDTLRVDHPQLLEQEEYTVTIGCGARDRSDPGLTIGGACPLTWRFTTAATPSLDILYPLGGERLSGGVPQTVRWIATDDEDDVRLVVEFSEDGGSSFSVLFDRVTATSWSGSASAITLPPVDTPSAVLRVTATDSIGLSTTATTPPFAVDSTPPTIVDSDPSDGAIDFDSMAPIRILFSEPIDPASFVAVRQDSIWSEGSAFSSVVLVDTTAQPFDTVVIEHTSIKHASVTTVQLDGIRDLSFPGNALITSLSFTVRDYISPVANLLVDEETIAGEAVVLDATASTDNDEIVNYTFTVRDGSGAEVSRLWGERAEFRPPSPGSYTVSVTVLDAAGNQDVGSAPLRAHAAGQDPGTLTDIQVTWLGWLALAGAGSSSTYALTDRGRSLLSRVFLLPLYVRLKPSAVMDQETRGMIRGYVRVHPGDCYTDIKRNLGLANGELTYHLSVLEREGVIHSVTKGAKRLYYPADMPIPENGGGLHEVQQRILKHVGEVPGMSVRDISGLLGVSKQLALYHVRKLREDGYVRFEHHGVGLRVFATALGERSTRSQGRTGDT